MAEFTNVVVADPIGMTERGGRTAMLVPSMPSDVYLVNGRWVGGGRWEYGRQVDELKLAGQLHYAVGQILGVKGFDGQVRCHVEVEAIKMITAADITDADIALMGYESREQWLEQTAGGLGGRRSWLLIVNVLSEDVLC